MKIQEWKNRNKDRRNYAHFDRKVSLDEVWNYINKPKNIEKHGFYPFIHYSQKFNKFSKNEGIIKRKTREICYSAHIDRCIFQLYGYKLNQLYNKKVVNDGINNCAIAYRDNLKKNNIHFAKKAIDFIKQSKNSYIIIGDFTKFFDSLDHKYLKCMLNNLLGSKGLPADYYAVYKNITKFSTWKLKSLLDINGFKDNRAGRQKLNKLDQVLSLEDFKLYKKTCIDPHTDNFGIPQGSAISAVLANIYMLEFDKKINDFILKENGIYMRYSDDLIIVLPKINEENFQKQFNCIKNIINSIPKLDLQPDKTKIFEFNNSIITSCNELVLEGVKNDKNLLNYLGFTFDGEIVTIRDKTISKYYYRMYRKLNTIVNCGGFTRKENQITCKNLYEKYTIKGANKGNGNFFSYVNKSEKIFGKNEAINRGTSKHLQKIRKKLNLIK